MFLSQSPISQSNNSIFFSSNNCSLKEAIQIWAHPKYGKVSTQANYARINRVCLRQNSEHSWPELRGHIPCLGIIRVVRQSGVPSASRSSPNTKYEIPRWNLGEFLNRLQAWGHYDPLTPSVQFGIFVHHLAANRSWVQSKGFRGPRAGF